MLEILRQRFSFLFLFIRLQFQISTLHRFIQTLTYITYLPTITLSNKQDVSYPLTYNTILSVLARCIISSSRYYLALFTLVALHSNHFKPSTCPNVHTVVWEILNFSLKFTLTSTINSTPLHHGLPNQLLPNQHPPHSRSNQSPPSLILHTHKHNLWSFAPRSSRIRHHWFRHNACIWKFHLLGHLQ